MYEISSLTNYFNDFVSKTSRPETAASNSISYDKWLVFRVYMPVSTIYRYSRLISAIVDI